MIEAFDTLTGVQDPAWVTWRNQWHFLLDQGRWFPTIRLEGSRAPNECFTNAGSAAIGGDCYVEGYAVASNGFPVAHAWNLTPAGVGVDLTWHSGHTPAAHFGVTYSPHFYRQHTLRTRTHGVVFASDWLDPAAIDLLRAGFPDQAIRS